MNTTLKMEHISKQYGEGTTHVSVIRNVSLEVKAGEFIALVGPSGSGKSTFLSMAGALLTPSSGTLVIAGEDVSQASAQRLTALRRKHIGFVFQSAHLLPYLTVRDQLVLVTQFEKSNNREVQTRADRLLQRLGLQHRMYHFPEQLSGGERQRVAIARAWMNDPELLLADEPTASLDAVRGREVVQMIADEVKLRDKAAIMVTHDHRVLDLCDSVLYMEDGTLKKEQLSS
ncbi:ABC transporter ATP-binding protein [Fictibacillus macauensis ZFHKF-1]|uniref:Putative hemin import ATP-binding protein HrtA n=1 Tax=Fictibacillus macauensis ZFHKF-1 TaxID=1196324 RepID=I8AHE3_9BACL|nr:ABC transporter ATP-binding protein [Fictibacillus macauensis]EIT84864.1 ABC transporter ATP-binding protein [Fictibacillus macauensis ZFHKF-1]